MPKRIFIGSLPFTTTSAAINTAFAPYGTIVRTVVNVDANGAPLGTANVEYTTDQAGTNAIAAKNGTQLDGQTISVVAAR